MDKKEQTASAILALAWISIEQMRLNPTDYSLRQKAIASIKGLLDDSPKQELEFEIRKERHEYQLWLNIGESSFWHINPGTLHKEPLERLATRLSESLGMVPKFIKEKKNEEENFDDSIVCIFITRDFWM